MRSRQFRTILFCILALVCLGCVFLFGYARGHRRAVLDDTEFGVGNYLALYRLEQKGDTNRLAARLRFMVYCYSDYHDRYFSNEISTNEVFFQRLVEARVIASQMRTQVVNVDTAMEQLKNMLQTNRVPSTARETNH